MRTKLLMNKRCLLAVAVLVTITAFAQDGRTVSEPAVPPVCRTLDAQLSLSGESLGEADEGKLDTPRIQKALDECRAGSAVELRANGANTAFLSGPLQLRPGITLLVSRGAVLFASRKPRDYDITPGTCGTIDNTGVGCRPLISVKVRDAAVMGDGVIDGRGGEKLVGHEISWWDLAEQARTNRVKIETPGHNAPHMIEAENADGLVLYRITLRNSPHFHVVVYRTDGFTAWNVKIHSPATARNTDGIDPSSSTNVSIVHSYIHGGDDHVAIKSGAKGPSTRMTIAHNHFYAGDGMSIGSGTSGGVSDVEVNDLTIDGARYGLHIKSSPNRGGLVRRISYRDVCLRDVQNPITFDTTYKAVTTGSLIPRYEEILLRDVRISGGGKLSLDGFDDAHPLRMKLDGVIAAKSPPVQFHASHAFIATGPGEVDFVPVGHAVVTTKVQGSHNVPSCENRFVPFPATK